MPSQVSDALPYGIRQIMLTPYTDAQATTLSSVSYPLPVAMTLGFSETEQYDELRGDDVLVAIHGRGAQVDWSLEAGGLPIMPWAIVTGGRVIEEGVSPNRTVRLLKSGDDQRPYFRIDGRVISDTGGNVVARIYKAKANGRIQADMRGGAFQTSRIDGVGLPLTGDGGKWLYEIFRNESDSALGTTPDANPLPIPTNLIPGPIASTTVGLTWDACAGADAYRVQQSSDAGITWVDVTAPHGGQPTTNTTSITTLTASTAYKFRVAMFKTAGSVTGDYGTPVAVTTTA